MKQVYEARIEHTPETIKRLYKIAYYGYEKKKVIVRFSLGMVLTVIGLMISFPLIVQGSMIMLGCWLLISIDFPARCKADLVLEKRAECLPTLTSSFYDNHVRLGGEGKMKFTYDQLQYLFEEQEYLYLFLSKDSAIMIDVHSLQPENLNMFKQFIKEKSNLDWNHGKTLLTMTLKDLLQLLSRN